jgi:hypothetical protein
MEPLPKHIDELNKNIAELECQIIEGIGLHEEPDLISFYETVIDALYHDMEKYYRSRALAH